MARSYNKQLVARASAILTTGEVAATALDLGVTHNAEVTVKADFTIGSLTNVILNFYASEDGTTYDLIYGPSGSATTITLTASDTISFPVPCLAGYKFFRASATGTGTVTSSLLELTYKWLRRGSQI